MPDFPTTPVNGDTHVIATSTWEYYSSTDRWEIQDTSHIPQYVSTLLETLTWSAGAATVTSSPIVYSNYVTLIITYTNVASNASVTTFEMRKPTGHITPRNYNSGEGVLPMNGTQTITTESGASVSVINLNGTVVTTAHSNTIGADYDPITFGWTAGVFAAGGSIEIRGISLQTASNTLANLDDVDAAIPTDGQVLAWDNTNSYWKPTTAATAAGAGNAGDVGTYAMLYEQGSALNPRNAGDSVAASSTLYYSGVSVPLGTDRVFEGASPSGTWRLMGNYSSIHAENNDPASVWLRIS